MNMRVSTLISTLVLAPMLAFAAPHSAEPDLENVPSEGTSSENKDVRLESVDVTTPPPAVKRRSEEVGSTEYFYPYQSAMGPRVGLILNSERFQARQLPDYILGFFYLAPSITSRHWEFEADLQSNSVGTLNGGPRWIFSPTESFRPFVKSLLGLTIDPGRALANFVDYKQYYLRIGAGIEDTLKDPASLRWDLEIDVGLKGTFTINVIFGYSWGW